MRLLTLVWIAAVLLCAGALLWMAILIALRVFSQRVEARRAADEAALQGAFVAALRGADVAQLLAPYQRRGRLVAEALLDFVTVVRGGDLQVVVGALRDAGADAILREQMDRGTLSDRLTCVEALGAFAGPTSQFALARAANRGPPRLRLAALRSLLEAGGEVPLQRLLDHLDKGELRPSGPFSELLCLVVARDPDVAAAILASPSLRAPSRLLLLDALGASGAYTALPRIIAEASSERPDIRAAAVEALGALKHPAAEPTLRAALDDPDWEVRAAAAEAIGDTGLTTLAERLGRRLVDPVWRVRHQSAAALVKLGAPGLTQLGNATLGTDAVAERAASMILAEHGLR